MVGLYPGDTIRIQATLTDYDDSALTPDSQLVTLYDQWRASKDTENTPTLVSEGVYYADLLIPATGSGGYWTIVWKITVSGEDKYEEYVFKVEEAP